MNTLAHASDSDFINLLKELVLSNIENEHMGVSELSQKTGISTHTLNRRLQSITGKPLNQFIREVRLQKAYELLQNNSFTAAEVAYETGFSSPAYFSKCFHDQYGFPPGKVPHGNGVPPAVPVADAAAYESRQPKPVNRFKVTSWLAGLLLVAATVAIGFYYGNIKRDHSNADTYEDKSLTSIAVMPFRNMTGDSSWNIWQEGIQSCLVNGLSNNERLTVRSDESVNEIIRSSGITSYASLKPEMAGTIAQKMGAVLFVFGSIFKTGDSVRIITQIIGSPDKPVIGSIHLDTDQHNVLKTADSLVRSITNALELKELKQLPPLEIHDYNDNATQSAECYRYYIYGNKAYYNNDFTVAIDWYQQALAIDSGFYKPIAKIATAYYNMNQFEQAKEWGARYYAKKDRMSLREKTGAEALHAIFYGNYNERITHLRQLLYFDDKNPMTWFNIGDCYYEMMEYDKAIPEFEKSLDLFSTFGTKPYWGAFYYELGICYHKTGQYRKEGKLYRQAEKDFPNDPGLMDQQAWLAIALGQTEEADRYLSQWRSIRTEEGWSEARLQSYMAYVYTMADKPDLQEQCLRKALALEPDKISRINNLAYFLVDTKRNVNEGLRLAEKALQQAPDNFNSMHIKGYALYRLKRYAEALNLMQQSWNLRMEKSIYNHRTFLQLEAAKKAVANSKLPL